MILVAMIGLLTLASEPCNLTALYERGYDGASAEAILAQCSASPVPNVRSDRSSEVKFFSCVSAKDRQCEAWRLSPAGANPIAQLDAWLVAKGAKLPGPPWDAPVVYGGTIPAGNGSEHWQLVIAGPPSRPCTPAQLADSYLRSVCKKKLGDVLYVIQPFRFGAK